MSSSSASAASKLAGASLDFAIDRKADWGSCRNTGKRPRAATFEMREADPDSVMSRGTVDDPFFCAG
jgi:hypothetical protein